MLQFSHVTNRVVGRVAFRDALRTKQTFSRSDGSPSVSGVVFYVTRDIVHVVRAICREVWTGGAV